MVLYYGKKSRGPGRARVESEWHAGLASTCWTDLLGIWPPTPIAAITRMHPFQGSACANDSWCWGFSLMPWLPLVFEAWAPHHVTPCFAVFWDLGRCPIVASFSSQFCLRTAEPRWDYLLMGGGVSKYHGSASVLCFVVSYKQVVEFTSIPLPMSQTYLAYIFLCLAKFSSQQLWMGSSSVVTLTRTSC